MTRNREYNEMETLPETREIENAERDLASAWLDTDHDYRLPVVAYRNFGDTVAYFVLLYSDKHLHKNPTLVSRNPHSHAQLDAGNAICHRQERVKINHLVG